MIKKISLPTRALVTLANNAVENENFPNSDEMNDFFDKFSQYCQNNNEADAITVDMNDMTESRFDGNYFETPHAISAYLSHESATHIFLQIESAVLAFVMSSKHPTSADIIILK